MIAAPKLRTPPIVAEIAVSATAKNELAIVEIGLAPPARCAPI